MPRVARKVHRGRTDVLGQEHTGTSGVQVDKLGDVVDFGVDDDPLAGNWNDIRGEAVAQNLPSHQACCAVRATNERYVITPRVVTRDRLGVDVREQPLLQ